MKVDYDKSRLALNMEKIEYLKVCDRITEDLNARSEIGRECSTPFKYFRVTLSSNVKSKENVNGKVGQGKIIIRQLNSVLRNKDVTNKTKKDNIQFGCGEFAI